MKRRVMLYWMAQTGTLCGLMKSQSVGPSESSLRLGFWQEYAGWRLTVQPTARKDIPNESAMV